MMPQILKLTKKAINGRQSSNIFMGSPYAEIIPKHALHHAIFNLWEAYSKIKAKKKTLFGDKSEKGCMRLGISATPAS